MDKLQEAYLYPQYLMLLFEEETRSILLLKRRKLFTQQTFLVAFDLTSMDM